MLRFSLLALVAFRLRYYHRFIFIFLLQWEMVKQSFLKHQLLRTSHLLRILQLVDGSVSPEEDRLWNMVRDCTCDNFSESLTPTFPKECMRRPCVCIKSVRVRPSTGDSSKEPKSATNFGRATSFENGQLAPAENGQMLLFGKNCIV